MLGFKKNSYIIIFLCVISICLPSCRKVSEPIENVIKVKSLSQEQKHIINLLSAEQKIILFDFNTEEKYRTREFWLEIYKNGEKIDSRAAEVISIYDQEISLSGEFVIIINKEIDSAWTFIYAEDNGSRVSHVGKNMLGYNTTEGIAYSSINEPTKIENEREIVLFSCVFKEGGFNQSQGHITDIINNLSIYDYSYIVKCKFTK